MEEIKGKWLTYPSESTGSGRTIIVTTRTDIDRFRDNPRFRYRITVGLPYREQTDGMPGDKESELLEQITAALADAFDKDPVAVLTEISTGDGLREWVFYTLSLHIFQRKLNEALAPFPLLPLQFDAEEDPEWESYTSVEE